MPLETNPLPAACGEAGAPKYTFMFRLGDVVLAQLSLAVTHQFARKAANECCYQVARLKSEGAEVSQKLLSSDL